MCGPFAGIKNIILIIKHHTFHLTVHYYCCACIMVPKLHHDTISYFYCNDAKVNKKSRYFLNTAIKYSQNMGALQS